MKAERLARLFAFRRGRCEEARGETVRRTDVRRNRIEEARTTERLGEGDKSPGASFCVSARQMRGSARRDGEAYGCTPQPDRRSADEADAPPKRKKWWR